MYTFLTRNGQTIGFGLGLLLVIIAIVSIFSGVDAFSAFADDDPARYETTIFNFGMYAAFLLIGLAFVAALIFGVMQLASDPKGAIKGIIGLAAVIAIFFIIYSAADPDSEMLARLSDFSVSDGQSKMITGAIWTALILAGAAVIATAVSEVINFFR